MLEFHIHDKHHILQNRRNKMAMDWLDDAQTHMHIYKWECLLLPDIWNVFFCYAVNQYHPFRHNTT